MPRKWKEERKRDRRKSNDEHKRPLDLPIIDEEIEALTGERNVNDVRRRPPKEPEERDRWADFYRDFLY